jgi:uroporphyrinogen-III synthase
MQTPRILVTRPEPGASRTAERLRNAGFEAVVLPLTRIERLPFELPDGPFDGLVVTSAQALAVVNVSYFAALPVVAVGDTTANAARQAGFKLIETGLGSVESVVALAASTFEPNSRLLYLCGKVRRPELETLLRQAGFSIVAAETYNAQPLKHQPGKLAGILGDKPFDAVILLSAVAAELFNQHVSKPQFSNALLVCFSQRIADAAGRFDRPIAVTEDATEDSLMKLLEKHYSK